MTALPTIGPCTPPTHRAPSPGQSMCTCRAQAIELEYALEVARVALAEEGRRLASRRDDLIAQGVDPADLAVPIHPSKADR